MEFKKLKELGYEKLFENEKEVSFLRVDNLLLKRIIILKNLRKFNFNHFLNDDKITDVGFAFIDEKTALAIFEAMDELEAKTNENSSSEEIEK